MPRHLLPLLLLLLLPLAAHPQDSFDLLEIERLQLEKQIRDFPLDQLPEAERIEKIREFDAQKQLMRARNDLLPVRIIARFYKIYTTDGTIAYQHVRFADEIYEHYQELFPDYRFAGNSPVHFLIYPDKASYLRYEGVNPSIAGHAYSRRITVQDLAAVGPGIEGLTKLAPDTVIQRLAFYLPGPGQKDDRTFAHELTHIFTWDMLNPQGGAANVPNLFLNEGLSEYMATRNSPDLFSQRLNPLRQRQEAPWPMGWLAFRDYPDAGQIRDFYAEALLFVSWLAEQPQAGSRLRALLQTGNEQEAEAVLQRLSVEKSIPRVNLKDYIVYRRERLAKP